nr:ABC transporter permease [Gemmobacter sp. 24YEA27]
MGYIARILRASMLEVMGENHIRTARAFGLSERRIMFDYVLRIALLPTITVLGMGIGQMLSGAVFAEIVFGRRRHRQAGLRFHRSAELPHRGRHSAGDHRLLRLVNLIADLLIAFLDPRVRNVVSR